MMGDGTVRTGELVDLQILFMDEGNRQLTVHLSVMFMPLQVSLIGQDILRQLQSEIGQTILTLTCNRASLKFPITTIPRNHNICMISDSMANFKDIERHGGRGCPAGAGNGTDRITVGRRVELTDNRVPVGRRDQESAVRPGHAGATGSRDERAWMIGKGEERQKKSQAIQQKLEERFGKKEPVETITVEPIETITLDTAKGAEKRKGSEEKGVGLGKRGYDCCYKVWRRTQG